MSCVGKRLCCMGWGGGDADQSGGPGLCRALCFVGEWEMLLLARGGRGSVGRADLSLKHRECRRPLSHGGGRVLEGGGGCTAPILLHFGAGPVQRQPL